VVYFRKNTIRTLEFYARDIQAKGAVERCSRGNGRRAARITGGRSLAGIETSSIA